MELKKECPLCGEMMMLRNTTSSTQVPGNPTPTTVVVREWSCPDCEYFEEAGVNDED